MGKQLDKHQTNKNDLSSKCKPRAAESAPSLPMVIPITAQNTPLITSQHLRFYFFFIFLIFFKVLISSSSAFSSSFLSSASSNHHHHHPNFTFSFPCPLKSLVCHNREAYHPLPRTPKKQLRTPCSEFSQNIGYVNMANWHHDFQL